jgi:hypothetical protein
LEEWSPEQIDRRGLGGSETAAVKLAEELVNRGLRVMVYGPSEGIWGGVFYRHYSKYNPQNPVFLTISWRNPALFDLPIQSQLKYLWMHDLSSGDALTPARAAKMDGIMALTEFHKAHLLATYPFLKRNVSPAPKVGKSLGRRDVAKVLVNRRSTETKALGDGVGGESARVKLSGTSDLGLSNTPNLASDLIGSDSSLIESVEPIEVFDATASNDLKEATNIATPVDGDLHLGLSSTGFHAGVVDIAQNALDAQLGQVGSDAANDLVVSSSDGNGHVDSGLGVGGSAAVDATLAVEVAPDVINGVVHQTMVPQMPEIFIVGNGLDPSRFEQAVDRNVHRFVYTSSPDRGLEQALNYWPKIKEALPDAELHIYYGFESYRRMRGVDGYEGHIMRLAQQPGVVWRGRVGQKALAKELMQASVLFYPGPHTFNETYCIAALEAQAAGCVPVTRDNGALPETNSRGVLVPNDASPEEWVDAAVKATGTHDRRRTFISEWARTQTWGLVADRLLAKVRAMAKAA